MSNFKEDLKHIKAFVFDVDGVFTDGTLFLLGDEQSRQMNIKDGFAVRYATMKGFIVCLITGGNSENVKTRFKGLGVEDVYLQSRDKVADFNDFLGKYNLIPESILYMGDDLPDYEVMKLVGLPTCPADAAVEIKSIARYISNFGGGKGCVRDVIEQVMRAQSIWFENNTFKWE